MNKTAWLPFLCLLLSFETGLAQKDSSATLKSILLEQLRTTHKTKDWFVPASLAVEGLSPEQANWKDSSENHSIAQLTTHLVFWNLHALESFNGHSKGNFTGDNKETFTPVTKTSWSNAVQRLDSVLTAWESAVTQADDKKLQQWYSTIAHIGTHNAYHTGQIIYIRKMKGWWNADNGVK